MEGKASCPHCGARLDPAKTAPTDGDAIERSMQAGSAKTVAGPARREPRLSVSTEPASVLDSTTSEATPQASAAELRAAVEQASRLGEPADEARTAAKPRPDKWCAREILGHLIDSACNNHRRFVIGQSPETQRYEGYEQDAWVARQRYREVPWRELWALWLAYNRHLAHVMQSTSPAAAARMALSPDGTDRVSIAFLMHDYVRHLRHHLAQIEALLDPHL